MLKHKKFRRTFGIGNQPQLKKWFYKLRREYNLTQKEMAKKVGIANNHFSYIINGKEFLSEYYYNKIIKAFELTEPQREFLLKFVKKKKTIYYKKADVIRAYLKAIEYIQKLEAELGIIPEDEAVLCDKFFME